MKKNFLKKISLMVAMLMCISSLGSIGAFASDIATAYLLPTDEVGTADAILGDFDAFLTTYGEGAHVKDETVNNWNYSNRLWQNGKWNAFLPNDWSNLRDWTDWGIVKLSDGNGALKTLSTADNTYFFRPAAYSDTTGIKKFETKIKLEDADNCTVYPIGVGSGIDSNNRWTLYHGIKGVSITNGVVKSDSTTIALAEALQDNTWYRFVQYIDFASNTSRVIVYKDLEDGKAYPIADSGEIWHALGRGTAWNAFGIMAICGAASNVTVDYFNVYDVEGIVNGSVSATDTNTVTLSFSRAMTQTEIDNIAFTVDGVADLTADKSFDADTNTLTASFSGSWEYETNYNLVISGSAINTLTVPFTTGEAPAEELEPANALVLPQVTTGGESHILGDFDSFLTTYGEGAHVKDETVNNWNYGGRLWQNGKWNAFLPNDWSNTRDWTDWGIVKLSDGNGALETLSTADNTYFFRPAAYSDTTGIKKFETKIKFEDADNCTVYPIGVGSGIDSNNRWTLYHGIKGVSITNGVVKSDSTTIALSESLKDNTWYKVTQYIDFDTNKTRVMISKVTNSGAACPIADTGDTWLAADRSTSWNAFGIMAICGATSNITVDYFKTEAVTDFVSGADVMKADNEVTFGFSRVMRDFEIEGLTFSMAGVSDLSADKVYNEEDNTLSVTFSGSWNYNTTYNLVMSGDAVNTLTVSVKTGDHPKEDYRPVLSAVKNENLGTPSYILGDFDAFLTTYGEGAHVKDETVNNWNYGGRLWQNGKWNGWLPNNWNSMKDYTDWGIVKLSDGNGALKTLSTADNTYFFRPAIYSDTTGIKKFETKIKLEDADNCTVYPIGVGAGIDSNNRWTLYHGIKGVSITNGVVKSDSTTIALAEELQDNTWYRFEQYIDFASNTSRVIVYKESDLGVTTQIGDTGDTWLALGRATTWNAFGIMAICGATSNVTVDYFSIAEYLGETGTLNNETSAFGGKYYFDAAMDNISVDASKITITSKDGTTVSGLTAGYDAEKELVYVDIPQLKFETEYVLTFAADSVVSNHATYGTLAMADNYVVNFTTAPDGTTVVSKTFLDGAGNALTSNTALAVNDTVKAQVVLSNENEYGGEYIVILALYDEFGEFYDVKVKEGTVLNSNGQVTVTTDAVTVTKANSEAAIMVWKDWVDMSPRTIKVVYPAE